MQYDRKIAIASGASRRATVWTTQTLMVSELWQKLKVPARGTETPCRIPKLKKSTARRSQGYWRLCRRYP